MSDTENIAIDEVIDLDNLDDLDDVEITELDEFMEVSEGDLELAAVAAAEPAGSGAGSERLWLVLTIASFVFALAASYWVRPIVDLQQQRLQTATDLPSAVKVANMTSASVLTSLTSDFDEAAESIQNVDVAAQNIISPSSSLSGVANSVFANQESNQALSAAWNEYQQAGNRFVSGKDDILSMRNKLVAFSNSLNKAVGDSVVFVEAVAKEGRTKNSGVAKDKYLFLTSEASNLSGILGRLSNTVQQFGSAETDVKALTDIQSGLMIRLQDTLDRIVGNSAAVVGTAAQPLQIQIDLLNTNLSDIIESSSSFIQSGEALQAMQSSGESLINRAEAATNKSSLQDLLATLSWLLPLLLAISGVFCLWRYSKFRSGGGVQHEAVLEETLAEQQDSILKLLDEMSALADGDLTVEAEVTDQITGAIADSVNYAVIEMRDLVSQINRASVEVAGESKQAVNNAQAVSQSNIRQAEEISAAAHLMQSVTKSMREMSVQATSSSELATESLKAANQGNEAVRGTIQGMEDMREQIQETSKRIKRLGESSQRIGDIVSLIDEIAEQTNILSLNAAIQASMAGEAGRGFAVVSDEVQNLAERSTEATKRIAELVTTIQNDTNDAVLSMEKATQQVVAGTRVADTAGDALSEIEEVSQRLSSLVTDISSSSKEQAEIVTKVTEQVSEVSKSSTETSEKSRASANSIAKLLELAKELEASVTRFKLPG